MCLKSWYLSQNLTDEYQLAEEWGKTVQTKNIICKVQKAWSVQGKRTRKWVVQVEWTRDTVVAEEIER